MRKIVLASSSPRRAELLKQAGLRFEIDAATEAEPEYTGGDPHQFARKVSLAKAEAVAGKHKDALVIAADTFGIAGGRFIGKPHTAAEARKMLAAISGKPHAVITGFTVIDTLTGKAFSRSVETTVYIRKLTGAEIEAYMATGEPLDKAGAYAIQGRGAAIVERIEGEYSNVVGLPLGALAQALKEFGIEVLSPGA